KEEKVSFLSMIREQFRNRPEFNVIFDISGIYKNYRRLVAGVDFKLPLNYDTINFIYNEGLTEATVETKALIQEVFIEVQNYVKQLPEQFIPFENFKAVVDAQYEETQMPELVLLKNKLLKFYEQGLFAQTQKDFEILKEQLATSKVLVIDVSKFEVSVQKQIISYVYSVLGNVGREFCSFLEVESGNFDGSLFKQIDNMENVYTIFVAPYSFNYLNNLKQCSSNIVFFAPIEKQNDFGPYAVFMEKLNHKEFVIFGERTRHIPFSVFVKETAVEERLDFDLKKSTVDIAEVQPMQEIRLDLEEEETPSIEQSYEPEHTYEPAYEEPSSVEEPVVEQTEQAQEYETPQDQQAPVYEQVEEPEPTEEEIAIANNYDEIIYENGQPTDDDDDIIINPVMDDDDDNVIMEEMVQDDVQEDVVIQEELTQEDFQEDFQQVEQQLEPETYEQVAQQEPAYEEPLYEESASVEEPVYEQPVHEEAPSYEQPAVEPSLDEQIVQDIDRIESVPASEVESSTEAMLSDEDLDFIEENIVADIPSQEPVAQEPVQEDVQSAAQADVLVSDVQQTEETPIVPVYKAAREPRVAHAPSKFAQGDVIMHDKYGRGTIVKIISYGGKHLCSIQFDESGKKLLDPEISPFEKI
ncbi:hypothetical protein IJV79_03895, partial [bacterium]|nr:hypothetical protein [bacterium]